MSLDDELKFLFVFMNTAAILVIGIGLLLWWKITIIVMIACAVAAASLTIYDISCEIVKHLKKDVIDRD